MGHRQINMALSYGLAVTALLICCYVLIAQAAVLHQADLQGLLRLQASDAVGCTRLLTAEGYLGCAAEGADAMLLAIQHPAQHLHQEAVVLLSSTNLDTFLIQVKTNSTLKLLVKGILVDPSDPPDRESPASKFPQSAFAPYNDPGFAWNPSGTGLAMDAFDFPILLLDNVTAPAAAQRATDNAQRGYNGVLHYAHLEAQMSAKSNSSTCIQQNTCQPLGGHSIWGAAPPLPPPTQPASIQLPIIMLLASIDSTAFFNSETVGAESAMGSLISLLAVADILGNNTAAVLSYSKRLLLTALMGEPWGYMGSKRMLWEMYSQADTTTGLDVENIQQVLELGQVGKAGAVQGQNYSFYAHSQRGAPYGDAASLVKALQHAAKHAGHLNMEVVPAAASNPGIPPSSLSSFLRVNPSIKGLVLADHEGPFINPYYESSQDTVSNIQGGSLAAAAVVVAQALHSLASGPATPPLQVDAAAVLETVNQLMACLLMDTPGLKCALGQQFLGKDNSAAVDHYVSVLRSLTKDSQDPTAGVKNSLERFIWNFLAVRLSQPGGAAACDFHKNPCQEGTVCAEYVQGLHPGHCVNATVSFVPSYSTHLTCKDCDGSSSFQWQETDSAVAWEELYDWPPDPMWTESNWPSGQPALQLFQKESKAKAQGVLVAGLVTAIASLAGVLGVQAMFTNLWRTIS